MAADSSNERLCDVFEMLISRLGFVEDSVKMQTIMLSNATRLRDSERVLGNTFPGEAWCNRIINLSVYEPFNEYGDFFLSDHKEIFIVHVDLSALKFDYNIFSTDAEWEFGNDLAKAWGEDKYKIFRSNMKNWCTLFTNDDQRSAGPMCNDVGAIEVDGVENYVSCAAYSAVFRHRHPEFLAIGPKGFAFRGVPSKCLDLTSLLKTIDQITRDLHMNLAKCLSINKTTANLRNLAISTLFDFETMLTAERALNETQRRDAVESRQSESPLFGWVDAREKRQN